jgi:hypothetical protein
MPGASRQSTMVPAEIFYELRRFYLDQLDARDRGDTQQWLDVFDDDATMTTKVLGHGSPVQKVDFVPAVRALDATFHAGGIQRRHCVHGFTFSTDNDLFYARFYALFLVTDAERASCLQSAAMISDVLRRSGPTWRVLSREIERDDLGRLNATLSN